MTSLSGFFSVGRRNQPGSAEDYAWNGLYGDFVFFPDTAASNAPDPQFTIASGVPVADYFSAVPIGGCGPAAPQENWPTRWLDAGPSATLTTPFAVVDIGRMRWSLDSEIFYNGWVEVFDAYRSQGNYVASVPGGRDRGPMQFSLTAPPDLVLTSPDVSTDIRIPLGSDLQLKWLPDGDSAQPVVLRLSLGLSDFSTDWVCKFADDGEATVPASVLSAASGGDRFGIAIKMARLRVNAFAFPDATSPVVGVAQSMIFQTIIRE